MSMWSGRSRSCCASAWIFFLAFFKVISRDSRPTPELKAPAKRVSVQRCPKVISWFRATVLTVDTPPKLLPPPPFRSAETKVPIAELPPCAFSSNWGENNINLLWVKSLEIQAPVHLIQWFLTPKQYHRLCKRNRPCGWSFSFNSIIAKIGTVNNQSDWFLWFRWHKCLYTVLWEWISLT